jgi:YihY family inner membrane protein
MGQMSTERSTDDTKAGLASEVAALEPSQAAKALPDVPIERVRPVVPASGAWPQTVALAKYMVQSEVHTYAFSVAANVILALFPFIVLLLTLTQNVFHNVAMTNMVSDMMSNILPTAQEFVMRNMRQLVHPHKGAQAFSVAMLLVSSTGVFLPLEVALNSVWGVRKNRSYLHNQVVSLGLAFAVGALATLSVAATSAQKEMMKWVFFGHTDNIFFNLVEKGTLTFFALIMSIVMFFLIYWVLPYRQVPARAVLPTAIVVGVLWEIGKYLYVMALPRLDFQAIYGPFYVTVGLMMWAFLSGLLLLAGAHFSATQYAISAAREAEREEVAKETMNHAASA